MNNEVEFIKGLEKRAQEQKRLVETEILPDWARGMGVWLAVNPWRVIAPLSVVAYYLWRLVFGATAREMVLAIFGGY